nr:MAG TPA: hypothetical protein [Microviridae sp.]
MEHLYFGIWDNVAKCYAWVGESKNNGTFARMCNTMAKDEKTFIGQSPQDYIGYQKQKQRNVCAYVQHDGKRRKDLHRAEPAGLYRLPVSSIQR